jgi:Mannosyltransferase (PIG-V)
VQRRAASDDTPDGHEKMPPARTASARGRGSMRPPSLGLLIAVATAAWLGMHLALWGYLAIRYNATLTGILNLWDAGNYTTIVRSGYSGYLWAFYPLYPFIVRCVTEGLGVTNVPLAGAAVSTVAFGVFVTLVVRWGSAMGDAGFAPRTLAGWLFFLFSPSSFVFHSHHTEALFVLFSYVALASSVRGALVLGGMSAALCALLRNQGVLVVIASAVIALSREVEPSRRLRALAMTGGIGTLGIVSFLLFQFLTSGSPWTFVAAQENWFHAESPVALLRTLYFGNPSQTVDGAILLRYAFFWLMVGGTLLLWRRQRALSLYAGASLVLVLAQGDFVNAFRYGAVLFPVLFEVGDASALLPRRARLAALAGWITLNLYVTRRYALAGWAY